MADQINTYAYAARVRHKLLVEIDDNPSDPTTLQVYLVDPSGVQSGPFAATRDGQGRYEYQKTYTGTVASAVWGDWDINWRGTGNAEGSTIRRIHIASSRFTV